jgi:ABC-type bacteriocin/lantibiotic exporter with double-glycine peptidase domain
MLILSKDIKKKKGQNVFTSFLELLQVKHTHEFSEKYFNEHPHKYNLFGISKMLSGYGIENAGVRITDKENSLATIELPFIAHLGNEFVVVYKVDAEKVFYIWNGKNLSIPIAEFIQAWTGIILLAEPSVNSIEPDYKAHKTKELLNFAQKAVLFAAVFMVLALAYIAHASFKEWGLNGLLTINLAGAYIGYLLILKQMHVQSKYADKICSLCYRFSFLTSRLSISLHSLILYGVSGIRK